MLQFAVESGSEEEQSVESDDKVEDPEKVSGMCLMCGSLCLHAYLCEVRRASFSVSSRGKISREFCHEMSVYREYSPRSHIEGCSVYMTPDLFSCSSVHRKPGGAGELFEISSLLLVLFS